MNRKTWLMLLALIATFGTVLTVYFHASGDRELAKLMMENSFFGFGIALFIGLFFGLDD